MIEVRVPEIKLFFRSAIEKAHPRDHAFHRVAPTGGADFLRRVRQPKMFRLQRFKPRVPIKDGHEFPALATFAPSADPFVVR